LSTIPHSLQALLAMNCYSSGSRWLPGLRTLVLACLACASSHANAPADEHAAHRQALHETARITTAAYVVPDVILQREDGRAVRLRELLAADRAVAVNFIFTTCQTVCPVMTATTLQLQRELAATDEVPEFISISIDPLVDSAPVLRAYAQRHGARWTFLTGSAEDVSTVLRAFDAWRGSKGNHEALTLFHRAHAADWIRVEGLASAQLLAGVWRTPPS
jgi:protein SCO1/2